MFKTTVLIMTMVLLLLSFSAFALPPSGDGEDGSVGGNKSFDNWTYINANKILMFVTNQGSFGRDLGGVFGHDYGTYYPFTTIEAIENGSNISSVIYAAGLWMGGIVNGEIRIAIAEYNQEYIQGPMVNGTYQPDNPAFRVYKLYSDSLEDNPNFDYLNWPVDQGAPVDENGNPEMIGHQMLWTVFNDADPNQHTNDAGNTNPLGIEIQQTVWAYDGPGTDTTYISEPVNAIHIGNSDGYVKAYLADPSALTHDEYMVVFEDDPELGLVWHLIDNTTSQVLLSNQTIQSADSSYEIDGMAIRVVDGTHGVDADWDGWSIPNGVRRFTWANANGLQFEGFYGAIGYNAPSHFFGGAEMVVNVDQLDNVLLKLADVSTTGDFDTNDPNVSYAYRYGSNFNLPPALPEFTPFILNTNGGYSFQDFEKSVPLTAWNIDVDPPQQLAVGFLENNAEFGLVDGKWFPGSYQDYNNTAENGPREWLFIMLDDYSVSPNYLYYTELITSSVPVMYWLTVNRRGDVPFETGDEFQIIPSKPNTPADTFLFTVPEYTTVVTGGEGNIIYIKCKLYNKSGNSIDSFYFSIWADPDLGGFTDDLVGCDTLNYLFFCYNGLNVDEQYGARPPAVGFKILEGLITPSTGDTANFDGNQIPNFKNLGMTSFQKYINGTDPNNFTESYNYMQGLNADGSPLPNGTKYAVPGDPVEGTGDLDSGFTDKRMMGTCGPITFNPGDSQYVLIKLAVGQGSDRLTSITKLIEILNDSTDCCIGIRGNVDGSDDDQIDIADIVYFIDYSFNNPPGPAPPCMKEADVNGDSSIDIEDIVYLIDYSFNLPPGPPPVDCQQ